jgi:hypothetical protein
MNPYVVSAQFAAYVWYSHENPQKSEEDAVTFARRNLVTFLPCAHKGVGKLLVKMTEGRRDRIDQAWSKHAKSSKKTSPRKPLVSR